MKDITLDSIDAYVEHLLNIGNSGSTVNRKLSCLSRILRTAFERDKIKTLPKMPRRREGTHRVRFLSIDEEEKLLAAVEHLGYIAHKEAISMLIYTGFRCSELWRLERRDVDLEHQTLTAWKTKNSHPRTIPIVETILPIIKRRIEATTNEDDRLFPEGSNPWLRNLWEKVRLHLGKDDDPQFVPHMLRHTCATRLSQRGASMMIIKEWMGHSDISTTARYTHFAPKDLRNAAQLLAQ
ncbi:MAG: site-specific integrase [Desulfovibrionaceae bacterium]